MIERIDVINREIQLPLWKMDLQRAEVEIIKQDLVNRYNANRLNGSDQAAVEAAVCFAEWWKTTYESGKTSELKVVRFIGLPDDAKDEIYDAARSALRILKIPIIKGYNSGYHYYFRTLLLQGGIPVHAICEREENFGCFEHFLNRLVYETRDKVVDWSDVGMVETLGCAEYLPRSFRNDDIYELGLQIVHAITANRKDLLPFDSNEKFAKLVERLTEKAGAHRTVTRSSKPLSLLWDLRIDGEKGILGYTLENRQCLSRDVLGQLPEDCYQFTIEADEKAMASYRNSGSSFYRMNLNSPHFIWKGESYIDVVAVCSGKDNTKIPVIDNYPPTFDYPSLMKKEGAHYVPSKKVDNEGCIVVFNPSFYRIEGENMSTPLQIGDKELCYCHVVDDIILINLGNNEPLHVKDLSTSYSAEFNEYPLNWLETANFPLIDRPPVISVFDEDGEHVFNCKNYYSQKPGGPWHHINRSTKLPWGITYIKVVFPDSKEKIQKYFNIGNLEVEFDSTSNKCELSISGAEGKVLCHECESVDIDQVGPSIFVLRRDCSNPVFPALFSFSVASPQNPTVEISVPTPFEEFCLLDRTSGRKVDENEFISMFNLNNYEIVSRGAGKRNISIEYCKETVPQDEQQTDTLPELKASIRVPISSNITSLSKYKEAIDSILDLNNHKTYMRDKYVEIRLGTNTYKIRRFTLDTKYDPENNLIWVSGLDGEITDEYIGSLLAIEMGDSIVNGDISYKKMQRVEDTNSFRLISDDQEQTVISMPFIVCSSYNDVNRVVPKLIGMDVSVKEENSVPVWIEKLLVSNPLQDFDIWKEVACAFEICTELALPFRTFNQLVAVAAHPRNFSNFILAMYENLKTEKVASGIIRFESEFAVALHWIRPSVWGESVSLMADELRSPAEWMNFIQYVADTISLTGGYAPYIMKGVNTVSSTVYFYQDAINSFRASTNNAEGDGVSLPIWDIHLQGNYYRREGNYDIRAKRQYTMINSPLYVMEYLTEKNEDLWTWAPENKQIRRVISFYSRQCYDTYNKILTQSLESK